MKYNEITPETKVGVLLDQFPQLENELLEISPAFKKLQNPILRKTIAKVATLRQVAQVGNVPLATVINTLRTKLGMEQVDDLSLESTDSQAKPDWFLQSRIITTLDARPLLESGQHPMNQVMTDLKKLKSGEIYELITPFLPAPLIDLVKKQGYKAWIMKDKNEIVMTYFAV
jgi:uncharacterized protein (DUF2249 family)